MLSRQEKFSGSIAKSALLKPLMNAHVSGLEDQLHRITIVTQLSSNPNIRKHLASRGANKLLVRSLRDGLLAEPDSDHTSLVKVWESVICKCCSGIAELAMDPHVEVDLISRGAVTPLMNAACLDHEPSVAAATRAIANLCISSDGKAAVLEESGASLLVSLLSCAHPAVVAGAAAAIANLALNPEAEAELLEVGAVEGLARNASSNNPAVQFHTARGFVVLTTKAQNRDLVIDAVGMGPFIALCQTPDLRVKKMGAKALANLGVHVEMQYEDLDQDLSLIHISEPTRLLSISYAVFCLKKKKYITKHHPKAMKTIKINKYNT
eukprot:TRINITY_DN24503_c0_g1_i1.p1 TRINITY_DN24503_c0_g1~~TRINITY_DN24503_c0_g1_i1.p1  ORF type:complete len:323 (-),score=67.00 TRINITY_DN24503_c0_g1_i1:36-1004(-)